MSRSDEQRNGEPKYEHSDVSIPALLKGLIIFGLAVAMVHGATVGLFWLMEDRPDIAPGGEEIVDPVPFAGIEPPPGTPRLQVSIADTLVRLIAQDEFLLSTYGSQVPSDSAVRIPVAKAMELLVERGLAVREEAAPFIPGRTRFSESGYRLTQDTAAAPNYFGYDTTVAVTSAEFHVAGHGPGEFHPRIQPPLGKGIVDISPVDEQQPVDVPTEAPEAQESDTRAPSRVD